MCGVEILRALPDRIVPGDSYDIVLAGREYPATAGYALRWLLAGPQVLTVDSQPMGADHALTLAAAATGGLTRGTYGTQLRVLNDGKVSTLARGTVQVLDDLSAFRPGEHTGPGYWDALVDACRTALLTGVQGGGMAGYMIGNRQVQFQSMDQVRRVLAWAEAKRARVRRGSAFGKVSVALTRGW